MAGHNEGGERSYTSLQRGKSEARGGAGGVGEPDLAEGGHPRESERGVRAPPDGAADQGAIKVGYVGRVR